MASAVLGRLIPDPRMAALAGRHRAGGEFVVGAVVGLLLLPTVFGALGSRDVAIGSHLSLVGSAWLVLALVASGIMFHARRGLARDVRASIGRLASDAPGDASGASDTATLGIAVGNGLLNLALLLAAQAVIRPPLVRIAVGLDLAATVDSAFVIVVVLLALGVLLELRRASRPLTERLARAALDQIVPTAGFVTPGAQAAFAARLATTTTARPTIAPPPKAGPSAAPSALSPSTEVPPAVAAPPEETVAAPAARPDALAGPTVAAEPTVLATPSAVVVPVHLTDATTSAEGDGPEEIGVAPAPRKREAEPPAILAETVVAEPAPDVEATGVAQPGSDLSAAAERGPNATVISLSTGPTETPRRPVPPKRLEKGEDETT